MQQQIDLKLDSCMSHLYPICLVSTVQTHVVIFTGLKKLMTLEPIQIDYERQNKKKKQRKTVAIIIRK